MKNTKKSDLMTVKEQILESIRSNPGITAGELASLLNKRFQHINNECGRLENSRLIRADRSSRPCRYYPEELSGQPDPRDNNSANTSAEKIDDSPYIVEFQKIIQNVSAAAGRKIDSGYEIIDRGIPHTPHTLKRGTMGIYTFLYKDEFLKIGKAGPNSNARFFSQHYNPVSAKSNLAKSILEDGRMSGLGITEENVGEWIHQNTRRIDILLDASLGIFTLELIEAALHFRYEPRYEGFQTQRKESEK